MEVILNVNNIQYEDILNDISIYIEKNTITTIAGNNNSGKTTLIKILGRLLKTNFNIIYKGKNINDFKLEEYSKIVKTIIPNEIIFIEKTVEDELYFHLDNNSKELVSLLEFIIKKLDLKKILNKNINTLNNKEKIKIQLALSLIDKPEILLIDSIDDYFDKKEFEKIIDLIKTFIKDYDLTVIMTTIHLKTSLYSNQLCIIKDGKIILQGDPLVVLQKDNIINKAGLEIPFMIDLSVKLRDYDLLEKVEIDKDRMIEQLWK